MQKLIILSLVLLASTNAFASSQLCGIDVQNDNIERATSKGISVLAVRDLVKTDQGAILAECFTANEGAVVVAKYPNGEIRAVIF